MVGGYQGAQAGAYAFVCAFASLWLPRLGLALLYVLLAVGVAGAGIGHGVVVASFLALVLALHTRSRDITPVKPDGSYAGRMDVHLLDGSHVAALVVLMPVLLGVGFANLPVLLLVTMAPPRFAWAAATFVASAVVLLPKVIAGRFVTALGASTLLPDTSSARLPAVRAPLDIVDMVQRLAHTNGNLLPASVGVALGEVLTLVGRHPILLFEAVMWLVVGLAAIWLRGVVTRSAAVRLLALHRLAVARLVALAAAGILLAVGEAVIGPALVTASPAPSRSDLMLQDVWHSSLVVLALLVADLAILQARTWLKLVPR
jgi:hypothetical protein